MEELYATDPVKVEPREGFTIWIKFADGTSGVVDLSFLADSPAFAGWKDRAFFESVRIDESRDVMWGSDLGRCGYALYIDLTGLPWQEVLARDAKPVAVV